MDSGGSCGRSEVGRWLRYTVAARAATVCGSATEDGTMRGGANWPLHVVTWECRRAQEDFRGLLGWGRATRNGILRAEVSPASCWWR